MIAEKQNVCKEAVDQVKAGIDKMHGKTYKLNELDSFTPSFWQMDEIADCFDLTEYGFSTNDWLGQEFEDGEEAKQDYADYYENSDALGFKPSQKEIDHAKKMFNYLDDNYSDSEILDTYHFSAPRSLTYKDIMTVFSAFKSAMTKCKPAQNMINQYQREIKDMSVLNWAD